jgi:diaminopimelate epimerase
MATNTTRLRSRTPDRIGTQFQGKRPMNGFSKYQALGNDYLILDPASLDFEVTPAGVRMLCDRNFGIGADGVVLGPAAVSGAGTTLRVNTFNSDGSNCPRSGNGLRMFALHLAERNQEWRRRNQTFRLVTTAGVSQVRITDFAAGEVAIDMGTPSFTAASIPMLDAKLQAWNGSTAAITLDVDGQQIIASSLSLGTPHTVVPVKDLSRRTATELGPLIARHPRFPVGSNVAFMRVTDRFHIDIEIWERAGGYAMASGASACAAAIVAKAGGLVDDHVAVRMPGGSLDVSVSNTTVSMAGTVEHIVDGTLASPFIRRLVAQVPAVMPA